MITACQGRNTQAAPASLSSCSNIFVVNIYTLILLGCVSSSVSAEEYFNPHLLEVEGSQSTSVDLSYLTQEVPPPGEYNLDVYVNSQFIASKLLTFKQMDARDKSSVQLCINIQDLKDWFVKTEDFDALSSADSECVKLTAYPEVKVNVSLSRQRVDLTIPQAMMLNLPKGYVPESRWEKGIMNRHGFNRHLRVI
ncbi:FimD/PapC N-terminal domain-containing protein [Kluyvera sp. CHPC 1.251]|uniref:FimD/PapC N-terminal domain-containing protein n=1 Tax=Kluyvera sp. CHPC 1.251 TaxID=2995175 RepID=UPI002FD7F2D4